MKTKFYWLALALSAILSAPAQAGNHSDNRSNSVRTSRTSGHGSAPSFHPMSRGNFSGARTIMSGQRFSSIGTSPMRTTVHRGFTPRTFARGNNFVPQRQFTSRSFNSDNHLTDQRQFTNRTFNGGNNFARSGNNNRVDRFNSLRNGNPSRSGAGVFARRSADWRRDWARNRDHWWNGHRCRFVGGSWIIFDIGFFPWFGYPYDYYPYYGYGYPYDYGYGYDPGYFGSSYYGQGVDPNHDQGGYYSSNQSADVTVADVQDQLARRGYYHGNIDGVLGPETRHALLRYQRDRGLVASGELTPQTLQSLGVQRVASY